MQLMLLPSSHRLTTICSRNRLRSRRWLAINSFALHDLQPAGDTSAAPTALNGLSSGLSSGLARPKANTWRASVRMPSKRIVLNCAVLAMKPSDRDVTLIATHWGKSLSRGNGRPRLP